jgi:hypothetical protein
MIQGQVTDAQTGETLPGANIYVSDADGNALQPTVGVSSDSNGFFDLDAPADSLITISYVGYSRQTYPAQVLYNMGMVQLEPNGALNDVVVNGKKSYTRYILAFSLVLALIFLIYLKKKGILS